MSGGPTIPTIDVFAPPSEDHAETVCKIGQGHDCCRYLTISKGGWSCERHTDLAAFLDTRAKAGLMVARAVNCDGRGTR